MQRHFDAALLLAAAVEIPRWTVTFLAIHEPLWVGVPLGALLAYAASEGWKAYFVDNRRWVLLTFNVATLLAATFVITPVLFALASGPIEQLDLTRILPAQWLLALAGVLAVTTFAPLIQLAAVKAGRTVAHDVAPATPAAAAPDADATHPTQAAAPTVASDADSDAVRPDKRTRALQLASEGYNASHIAREVDANYSTVRSWLQRAAANVTQPTNGREHL